MSDKESKQCFIRRSFRLSNGILDAYMRFCDAQKAFNTVLISENGSKFDVTSVSAKGLLADTVRHLEDSIQALKETGIQFEYLKDAVPCFNFSHDELTIIGAMLTSEGAVSIATVQKISKALRKQNHGNMITYLESEALALYEKMNTLKKEFTKTHHRKVTSYLKNDREPNILVDMGRMTREWGELQEMVLFMHLAYKSKIFGKMNLSRVLRP